jgi:hypothetical protein
MARLKPISDAAVPAALEKALRYRLLNEPLEAESICLDVLHADGDNQEAVVTLLLARTDLFGDEYTAAFERAKAVLPKLSSEYDRAYYEGVIHERWAKAQTDRGVPAHVVTGWYLHAMHCFERAESLATSDNPDAILRWNTCARLLDRAEKSAVAEHDQSIIRDIEAEFGDEARTR